MTDVKAPKKLIEVALPLDDINAACAREKSIRHGHPSTLHLWWARRPLAAARAVLFAQLVNDPGYEQGGGFKRGVNKEKAAVERERLFGIIRELVKWENTNNADVLRQAREEIWKSWRETCALNKQHPQAAELFNPDKLPAFHDPFAGGGTIPLEALRLGLESHASDLNPVAVLINKAMIEIPPKFAGRAPVGPPLPGDDRKLVQHEWPGATGLAEDVRRYGHWLREEAFKRIGHLYPPVEITAAMAAERPDLQRLVGQKLTVIAWLWARTVKSPNPAFSHVEVPLVSTFMLSAKEGKEAYVEPVIDGDQYRFTVKNGLPNNPEKANSGTKASGAGANFLCLMSNTPINGKYIQEEGQAARLGTRLMAAIAEGQRGRVYISPTPEMESVANGACPEWRPQVEFFQKALGFRIGNYGLTTWADLFTARQLVALTTFSNLVLEVRERVCKDALAAWMDSRDWRSDERPLNAGGFGPNAYADAVATYLAFAADKASEGSTAQCTWSPLPTKLHVVSTFGRQALPMTWDFAESNVFSDSSGNILRMSELVANVVARQCSQNVLPGESRQMDAARLQLAYAPIVSSDPPYYDNIGYADLSDFFYVWLRRALKPVFPDLFATVAVPKAEELVATPSRHGSKEKAEGFFLSGMTQAMRRLAEQAHAAFPVTISYAFKQAESEDVEGTASTGWETFLEALIAAGFSISGTWPMRTERSGGFRNSVRNSLASSIVLVCCKRDPAAPSVSRREFIRELNAALPEALDEMTRGAEHSPVAPVDLSQAIIGPGMAIFSKYAAVLEADGKPMTVRTALQLINRFLAEDDFDHDTQFCLHWFEGYGWDEGKFGEADVLARAKGTSVAGVANSGVIASGKGAVRLLRFTEYATDWTPDNDARLPVWESLHHLIRALQASGESASGALLAKMPTRVEAIRQLAYRLYTLCERTKRAEDARAYNELITSWSAVEAASQAVAPSAGQKQFDFL